MAIGASQIRMHAALVAISTGRDSPLPCLQHDAIADAHCLRQTRIKVTVNFDSHTRQLVTDMAIRRNRRDSGVGIVTSETARMTRRNRVERALLQPECIA